MTTTTQNIFSSVSKLHLSKLVFIYSLFLFRECFEVLQLNQHRLCTILQCALNNITHCDIYCTQSDKIISPKVYPWCHCLFDKMMLDVQTNKDRLYLPTQKRSSTAVISSLSHISHLNMWERETKIIYPNQLCQILMDIYFYYPDSQHSVS